MKASMNLARNCFSGVNSFVVTPPPLLHPSFYLHIIVIIFYCCSSKGNEGSNYNDATRGASKADNAVEPGKLYKYTWKVPERAGPGPNGPSCATWAYYSDVNPIKDTNSGLVGPLIICKKVRKIMIALTYQFSVIQFLLSRFSHYMLGIL